MVMDNQLSGGFFVSPGPDRAGAQAALAQFKRYETACHGVEELSPTKRLKIVNLVGYRRRLCCC